MRAPLLHSGRMNLRSLCAAACLVSLAGCGGSRWPFGEKSTELARVPANATEYRCNNDRRFHARWLENGAAVWVIYPEREFRLDKVAAEGRRYSNGPAMLEENDGVVSLRDGNVAFTGCRDAKAESR